MLDYLDDVKKNFREYLEIKLELLKLNTAESISRVLSTVAIVVTVFIMLLLVLLFSSVSAGFYIASLLNSNALGFLCIAVFYFALLLIFLLFRKNLVERPVIRFIVKLFFQKHNGDEKK